ncbi:helix-turn-helix domain-containing protein [Saccharopolyspora gloriosae]|uniref:DNA-binding HxlR family transcriptional regulator n=1 Tax=Saccharopolyspora gloriosae TaxID=455344 RepID=A0A840NDB1_9PSEU|nr:helix-turn-helix domain-containing protein [Saccharopolyspora gloriosae]MBB5070316.1 DNA-binding HxlR family transcriptional regulator [Saccharopolyspora gloriosae]
MAGRVAECGLTAALAVMVGKWKPLIIWELAVHGTMRFSELRRRLDPISEKVLTQQLRELEAHDLVSRTVHPVVPPHVDYAATAFGESLNRALEPLGAWGHEHAARIAHVTSDSQG